GPRRVRRRQRQADRDGAVRTPRERRPRGRARARRALPAVDRGAAAPGVATLRPSGAPTADRAGLSRRERPPRRDSSVPGRHLTMWTFAWWWLLAALPVPWLVRRFWPPQTIEHDVALRVPAAAEFAELEHGGRGVGPRRW